MNNLNDILDGLTPAELYKLINDLFNSRATVSRPNVLGWIKRNKPELFRDLIKEKVYDTLSINR